MNKKLIIQILTVELVRSLFIAVMILGVALVSNGNNQMVMNPQILSKMHTASRTEQLFIYTETVSVGHWSHWCLYEIHYLCHIIPGSSSYT